MANTTLNTWHDVSTICFGLILTKRVDLTKFHPTQFVPPYEDGLESWKRYGDVNRVIEIVTNNLYEAAIQAASTVSDINEVDWSKYLLRVSRAYKVGDKAESVGKALKMGKDVPAEKIVELASSIKNLANPDAIGLKPFHEINVDEFEPFVETGWPALDDNLGGISAHRPTLVGGMTGLGKTTWSMRLITSFLRRWPTSKVAVYSLELSSEAWKYKAYKLFPSIKDFEHDGRLFVSSSAVSATDVGLEIVSLNADLTIIDDIGYLVKKDTPEEYAAVNKHLNEICRVHKRPMIVISQFNADRYSSPIPTMKSFAWGSQANNSAGLVLTLARFNSDDETGEMFSYMPDYPMAILVWKSGDGWPKQQGPGGIFLPEVKNLWANDSGIWQKAGGQPVNKTIKRRD